MLSTIYLYKKSFPNDTNTDTNITQALSLATSILENYCTRSFERTTYTDYLDGYGTSSLVLKNYPITAIYDIAPDIYDGIYITVANTVYSCNYRTSETNIILTVIDFDGTETSTTLAFADYPQMSELETAINAIVGISASLNSAYDTEPSRHLKQDNGLIVSGQSDYLQFYKQDLQLKYIIDPETYNVVKATREFPFGIKNIYIKYQAGYEYPVDNAGHTALTTAGTVPTDLTYICNSLVSVLLHTMANGLKNYNLQSERLGDYGYANVNYNGKPVSEIESFILANKALLDKYRYKELTW